MSDGIRADRPCGNGKEYIQRLPEDSQWEAWSGPMSGPNPRRMFEWMRQSDAILERRFVSLAEVERMLADGWEARHERDVVKFRRVVQDEIEAREAARRTL